MPPFETLPLAAPLADQFEGGTVLDLETDGETSLLALAGPAGAPLKDVTGARAGFVRLAVVRVRGGAIEARATIGDFLLPLDRPTVAVSRFGSYSGRPTLVVSTPSDPTSERGRLLVFSLDPGSLAPRVPTELDLPAPVLWYPRIEDGLQFALEPATAPRQCRVDLAHIAALDRWSCFKDGLEAIAESYRIQKQVATARLHPSDTKTLVEKFVRDGRVDPCQAPFDTALASGNLEAAAELATRAECRGLPAPKVEDRFKSALQTRAGCDDGPALERLATAVAGYRESRGTHLGVVLARVVEAAAAKRPESCGKDALRALEAGRVDEAQRRLEAGAIATPFELEFAAAAGLDRAPRAALLAFAKARGLTGLVADLESPPNGDVRTARQRARRLRPASPYAAAFAQAVARRLGDTRPYLAAPGEPTPEFAPPPVLAGGPLRFAVDAPAECPDEVKRYVAQNRVPPGPFRGYLVDTVSCGMTEGGDHVERTERVVEREVVGQMRCDQAGAATADPLSGCQGLQKKRFVEEGVRVVKDRGSAIVSGSARYVDGARHTPQAEWTSSPTSIGSGYFEQDVRRAIDRKASLSGRAEEANFQAELRNLGGADAKEEACARHLARGGSAPGARKTLQEAYGKDPDWPGWPWNDR